MSWLDRLTEMGFWILVYVTAQDMLEHAGYAWQLEQEGVFFHILVTGKTGDKVFQRENVAEKENYTFVITSEAEYDQAMKDMEQYQLNRADVIPVYTGENLSFFEECVYLTQEELNEMALTKREIFIR